MEDIHIYDAGDLHILESASDTLSRLESVCKEIVADGKVPLVLGGEHTISHGVARAIGKDIAVVDFDAHMDLRSDYMGDQFSHACVMRRISEFIGAHNLFEFGVRAFSREEFAYADSQGVWHMSDTEMRRLRLSQAISNLEQMLSNFQAVYLTIDMDVLDPAYAPGVGNPEGDGMDPLSVIEAVCRVCKSKVVGIDLVEVTPNYDNGSTAVQAARILFEVLCSIERHKRIQ